MVSTGWTAEITNDPERNYELYIELLEDSEYRGRIFRGDSKELILEIYGGEGSFQVPLSWLREIIDGAQHDLK